MKAMRLLLAELTNSCSTFVNIKMRRDQVLELLKQSKPELAQRFGVTQLAVFGSVARDAAHAQSDVDILVAFSGPATSERYFGVQFYLEDLLGLSVDLVTEKALRSELRPYIESAWEFYIDDMICFAERVVSYTSGLDQWGFVTNTLTYDATLRNLELIGEAAIHIPDVTRAGNPQIPWRMIIATRNRLIHGYLGIDNDTLWSIVTDDVPTLLTQLKALRQSLQFP
jgi:uncharacterized protein with HEPN domain/predicted nucleotidyltransferase